MTGIETSNKANSPSSKRSCALAVMAKAPLTGTVKTRLVPPLTPEEAAGLSACFLRDTGNNLADIGMLHGADGVIIYTPAAARAAFAGLLPEGFQLLSQRGESLGDRLLNATRDLLAQNYESICLINSDSHTLAPAILESAIAALAPAGDRVVLGPAEDGGYYLIGLKHAHQNLFDRVAWSTSEVIDQTVERAREISLEVVILPVWYDVDAGPTLERLCRELFLPTSISNNGNNSYAAPFTREYLADLLAKDGHDRIWPGAATEIKF